MDFSYAQFQEIINKLNSGMNELSNKIAEIPQAVHVAMDHWYILEVVKDVISWLAEKIAELATWILNKIKEVMAGIAAPICFFQYAFDWQDIRGIANGVTGELKPEVMAATTTWTSPAGTAYSRSIKPQGDAANKIATIAVGTAGVLQICAGAGVIFYVAIAAVLVKVIVAIAAAIATLISAFFPAAAPLALEEFAVSGGLIWTAIGALITVLIVQKQEIIGLHGEAIDNSTFPRGHWPDPTTGSYRHP